MKKPSELTEGEIINITFNHGPGIQIEFVYEYGMLNAYIVDRLGESTSLYGTPTTYDDIAEQAVRNGAWRWIELKGATHNPVV